MQECKYILGMKVDATSYAGATAKVLEWAERTESRYVCVANVHMVMEAYDSTEFRQIINKADLVTPDGMPLVWGLRLLGIGKQQRVYGPELTLVVCQAAMEAGIPVGFWGGTEDTLDKLQTFLQARFPSLKIGCMISPPFRTLAEDENMAFAQQIFSSGVRILFVGVGCPKQERWMASQKGVLPAVMLGVGAAFDFHSGRVKQAPSLLQNMGLEWLFRLLMEPRRLFMRYLKHNPRFVGLFCMQVLRSKLRLGQ